MPLGREEKGVEHTKYDCDFANPRIMKSVNRVLSLLYPSLCLMVLNGIKPDSCEMIVVRHEFNCPQPGPSA